MESWAFAILSCGLIIAVIGLMSASHSRGFYDFLPWATAVVSLGVFLDAVLRWDLLGTQYDDTPWIAAVAIVAGLAVYQIQNLCAVVRGRVLPTLSQAAKAVLPLLLPLWLVLDYDRPALSVEGLLFPLPPGEWFIAQGGATILLNEHASLPAQRYAIDITKVGANGKSRAEESKTDLGDYFIYGTHVLAPCTGRVAALKEGIPSRLFPSRTEGGEWGNFIAFACDEFTVVLSNLQPEMELGPGEFVPAGSVVGHVGKSGGLSEPLLHMHAIAGTPQTEEALFETGKSVPMLFGGRTLDRNDRVSVPN